MRIHEYQAKRLLAGFGVPAPRGEAVTTAAEARAVAEELGGRAVVKAQVLAGGRGKAGGVIRVSSPAEAAAAAERLLGRPLVTGQTGPAGRLVRRVLVEESLSIARELYAGVTVDRASGRAVLLLAPHGGVDIELLAAATPELLSRVPVDPDAGLRPGPAEAAVRMLGLAEPAVMQAAAIATALVRAFESTDASLIELNPLALTSAGALIAADAKVELDDNGLVRHPDLRALRDPDELSAEETEAAAAGLSFVRLDGDIGCLVNGAGLAMATMDLVALAGGRPANFLDVGGGVSEDGIARAFALLTGDPRVRAVLVNIFGGIVRCDLVARALVRAARERGVRVPVVLRLEGTNVEEGRRIVAESGLPFSSAPDMEAAAREAVRRAREAGEAR
jgi:succinyl-CoA synthetase beta subunit